MAKANLKLKPMAEMPYKVQGLPNGTGAGQVEPSVQTGNLGITPIGGGLSLVSGNKPGTSMGTYDMQAWPGKRGLDGFVQANTTTGPFTAPVNADACSDGLHRP